jgi:uncharacterized membrane protein
MSTPPSSVGTAPLSARKVLQSILLSKGRMEALTDGIFAISMTLLVLELKIPDLPKTAGVSELLHRIGEEGPAFASFIFSFLYCGMLWMMHHMAMHFFRHLQLGLMSLLNMLFLMSISVMPFSCALLGHFLHNKAAEEIYFGNMFVAAGLIAVQWLVAKNKHLLTESDPQACMLMGQRIMFFPIGIGAGMVGAYFSIVAGFYSMAICFLVLRVWQKRWFRSRSTVPSTNP